MARKINVNDIRPGMRLAADLSSDMGRFLLARGTPLEERHQRIFKIWGVSAVDVEDQTPAAGSPISPEALEAADALVKARFRLNEGTDQVVEELRRLCLDRVLAERTAAPMPVRRKPRAANGTDAPAESAGQPEPAVDMEALARKHRTTPDALLGCGDVVLPALPRVLMDLLDAVNNPRCSALDIARVVEKDTTLTARLLRIVNSPFYGFPSRIDTISRAVTIIGSRQLTTLAVGVAAIRHFQGIPQDLVDMAAFWRHSLLVGYASRLLASNTNTPNSERFFVAGLLHDIGKLALFKLQPAASAACLTAARQQGEAAHRMERRAFGFDHGVLGGTLLKQWNFPVALEQAVRYHHNPMQSPSPKESGMVHFADVLVWAVQTGQQAVPPLNQAAWAGLGLPAVSLASLIEQCEFLFNQTARFFLDG